MRALCNRSVTDEEIRSTHSLKVSISSTKLVLSLTLPTGTRPMRNSWILSKITSSWAKAMGTTVFTRPRCRQSTCNSRATPSPWWASSTGRVGLATYSSSIQCSSPLRGSASFLTERVFGHRGLRSFMHTVEARTSYKSSTALRQSRSCFHRKTNNIHTPELTLYRLTAPLPVFPAWTV